MLIIACCFVNGMSSSDPHLSPLAVLMGGWLADTSGSDKKNKMSCDSSNLGKKCSDKEFTDICKNEDSLGWKCYCEG
jgi:hypothetical protein